MMLSLVPLTYRYWPSGYAQIYVFLLLKGDDYKALLALAESKGYSRIVWCRDDDIADLEKISGVSVIEWKSDPDFSAFSNLAIQSNISCFIGREHRGRWLLHGGGDFEFEERGDQVWNKSISWFFFVSTEKVERQCRKDSFENTEFQECTFNMLGDWYVNEEVMTYPPQEYQYNQ
ncbi:hypothetical protein EYS14_23045 [Alteromonadaceae bacterium M269]|nr:hypothetical protein EYS14_23045 [Alteromonadaceae bacterium M269]